MHTGARARKQKCISIYISLYMKTFLKTGVYIYTVYIYIYIYIYILRFNNLTLEVNKKSLRELKFIQNSSKNRF